MTVQRGHSHCCSILAAGPRAARGFPRARLSRIDESDIALRNTTYRLFVDLGRAPTAADVADDLATTPALVVEGWHRLHDAHALVLNANTDELRMANPFSAAPTAYRVNAAGRWWYATCAWDAMGILSALHVDGRIDTSCADCGDPMSICVTDERPDDESPLFHCLVPARQWWSDIVFT